MTEEQTSLVKEFVRSDFHKVASTLLDLRVKELGERLVSAELSDEKSFLALKYELEGAKKVVAHFKNQITRLRASDLSGNPQ